MGKSSRHEVLARLQPYVERARAMKGWTFAEVQSVRIGSEMPWDYMARARELVAGARSVLDMGTGGGEKLARKCEGYGGFAVATEAWSGNIRVASERLAALDVPVVYADSLHLPFVDSSFELVLNRHEELDPAEVAPVLAPGGHVLTQQVAHDSWRELAEFFPRMTRFDNHFVRYQDGLRQSGLTVRVAETNDTAVAYRSLGDVAYLLIVTPWTVPEFDLEHDLDALLALEDGLGTEDGIVLTEGRHIIETSKDRALN